MRSFIQLTNTDNDILRSLPLGDLSSITTYYFRIWNNLPQSIGVAALDGLKLDLMYPPKQGIKTLVNNDAIKIRCIYSGERSQIVTSNFQNFPIKDENYDRLEPNTYNEYEVQIDFSNLSIEQKASINLINMEFNITANYNTVHVPYSEPFIFKLGSSTIIREPSFKIMLLSDTLIDALEELLVLADSRIKRLGLNALPIISHTKIKTPFIMDILVDSIVLVPITTSVLVDTRVVEFFGTEKSIAADIRIKRLGIDNILPIDIGVETRVKNTYEAIHDPTGTADPIIGDSRIKVLGVNAYRLEIEANTLIV